MFSVFQGLARRLGERPRHRNDPSTEAELRGSLEERGLPQGLEVRWLGTAGFRMSYEGRHLLIDPYVTRIALSDVLFGGRVRPRTDLLSHYAAPADAILVGHTHFDHALDVPAIARQNGALAYGSRSLARLMDAHGLVHQSVTVLPYERYEVGPFEVTFVPSLHSRLLLGRKVPYEGEITCEHAGRFSASDYRCGDVYGIHVRVAGVTFYHQGSADLIDECIRHRDVDFFLAGISGRSVTTRYVERILTRLNPRVVVPTHYDNFFDPLGDPMRLLPDVNVGGFVEEVRAVSTDFDVCTLPAPGPLPPSEDGNLTPPS